MRTKVIRSLSIDPDVWHQTQAHALSLERSASWLTERVLREFLACEKLARAKGKKPRAPKLEATADLGA